MNPTTDDIELDELRKKHEHWKAHAKTLHTSISDRSCISVRKYPHPTKLGQPDQYTIYEYVNTSRGWEHFQTDSGMSEVEAIKSLCDSATQGFDNQ